MSVPDRCRLFWQEFARSRASDPTLHFLEAFHFDDNEPSANGLAGLVLSGQKRAGAALLWVYEVDSRKSRKSSPPQKAKETDRWPTGVAPTRHSSAASAGASGGNLPRTCPWSAS